MPLELQLYTFSLMVLTGTVLGLAFDIYRVFRGVTGARGGVLSQFGDLLFWVMATALVAVALWQGNWGELRLYVFLGLGLGLAFYYRLASTVIIALTARFFHLCRRVYSFFLRTLVAALGILLAVVLFPYRILRYFWRGPVRAAWRLVTAPVRALARAVLYPWRMLGKAVGGMAVGAASSLKGGLRGLVSVITGRKIEK